MQSRGTQWALSILNLREDEIPLVKYLLLLNFFQGIGIAFFFTTANALFLSAYKVTYLPFVYLASAILLLLMGRIYAYYEHILPMEKLKPGVALFLAISPLLFFFGIFSLKLLWLPFLLMVWHRIMYLFKNLGFWGLSSVVFDVRQSKRLFSLISAGDIPAKLLGYLAVSVLVPYIGMESLLLISSISFFTGFFLLKQVFKAGESKIKEQSHHPHAPNDEAVPGKIQFLKKFFGHHFILILSIFSFLVITALTVIDFSFLSEVKYEFKTDKQLASFFGLFFGLGNAVTIVTKLFFSGRIINKIGIKSGLLILPLLLLIVSIITTLFGFVTEEHYTFLWLFGIIMLISEVFNYTLHEPIFLSLFQPLSRHQRLHGHTVVKAFINPIGLGLAGLILSGFIYFQGGINLFYTNFLLLFLIIGWIIMVLVTSRKYVDVLKNAIDQHIFKGSGNTIQDKTTLDLLTRKTKSKKPEEVIHAAELLEKYQDDAFDDLIVQLLNHSSNDVKIFALDKVEARQIHQASRQVSKIIEESEDLSVKEHAIEAYCQIEAEALDILQPYLEDSTDTVKKGTIVGLMKSGSIEGMVMGGQKLLELYQSDDPNSRKMGADIIGKLGMKHFYQPLLKLLDDDNVEVREAALQATGNVGNLKLLPKVINLLDDVQCTSEANYALRKFDEEAVPQIVYAINNATNTKLSIKLCTALGYISGKESINALLKLLDHPVSSIRATALYALRKLQYKVNGQDEQEKVKLLIENQIKAAYWYMRAETKFDDGEALNLIKHSLQHERNVTLQQIFIVLAFIYDQNTIIHAEENLAMDEKENRANAVETLDNLLPKNFSEPLIAIIDERPLADKLNFLSYRYSIDESGQNDFIETILKEGTGAFNRWTIAVTLNACHSGLFHYQESWIKPYTDHESTIVNELANRVLNQKSNIMENQDAKLLNIEKVLILKSTSVFSATPENVLVDIASITKELFMPQGTQLMEKGDIGRAMYIIYNGAVEIHDQDHVFTTLKEKDILGELALLDPEPRSASATTVADSLLLRIDQEPFYELMIEREEVARNILKVLCRRIRDQNQQILNLKEVGTANS